jgi:DNA-binding MarR family transcriptional regulator
MSHAKKASTPPMLDDAATGTLTHTKTSTKSAAVLTLLQREQGATLGEIVEATEWQPHTSRAMLTGLRKKGHVIDRRKRDDVTCYHLLAADA